MKLTVPSSQSEARNGPNTSAVDIEAPFDYGSETLCEKCYKPVPLWDDISKQPITAACKSCFMYKYVV